MDKFIKTFDSKLPKLSKNEQEVLNLLLEAGKLIAPVYAQQKNDQYPGANFYPHDVSKEEIEKAAQNDPDILSPYTVVEKKDGQLVSIPYHKKYADLLLPIADKLLEAAKITNNKEFSKGLEIQAHALLNGDYARASAFWMTIKSYILDINIGPVERYDDKLFFTKTAYQSWVGIMDEENTSRLVTYKDMILSARRKAMMPSEKVDYYDKVQIRIDDLLLFSGLLSQTLFVGINLPNDPKLMEEYGSEITLFKQTNQIRHKNIQKMFNKIFSPEFQQQFTSEDLEKGSLYSTALHELAHTYLRYRDSEDRLEDFFPIIDELAATVMGIKVGGSLLLKDAVDQKQLEIIMLAYLARSFHNILNEKDNKSRYHYVVGGAIFINYLLDSGAIRESRGVSWPNFTKMFVAIDELGEKLERILSRGTRRDAEELINKYGDFEKLQRFS